MKKFNILVVEDNTIEAKDIASALKQFGHHVVGTVKDYSYALDMIESFSPDLIILDINLQGTHTGIDLADTLRKEQKNIPFIYLTAYFDEITIQKAVQTDPIAYLGKPFKREELKSAIMLAAYKQSVLLPASTQYTSLGKGYYFDPKSLKLFFHEFPLKLSKKEQKLLGILVGARGNIVSYESLEIALWPDGGITNSSLRTVVYRLHLKLEFKLIESIPSFGYRLKITADEKS